MYDWNIYAAAYVEGISTKCLENSILTDSSMLQQINILDSCIPIFFFYVLIFLLSQKKRMRKQIEYMDFMYGVFDFPVAAKILSIFLDKLDLKRNRSIKNGFHLFLISSRNKKINANHIEKKSNYVHIFLRGF